MINIRPKNSALNKKSIIEEFMIVKIKNKQNEQGYLIKKLENY